MKRLISTVLYFVLFATTSQAGEPQTDVIEERDAMSTTVTILVRYNLLPDRIDQAKRDIMQLVSTVIAEESDCLGIEVLHDADDPTRVTLVERWTSREVYEGPHMQTEHLQSFIARARDNFAGPPDISFWNSQGAQ